MPLTSKTVSGISNIVSEELAGLDCVAEHATAISPAPFTLQRDARLLRLRFAGLPMRAVTTFDDGRSKAPGIVREVGRAADAYR